MSSIAPAATPPVNLPLASVDSESAREARIRKTQEETAQATQQEQQDLQNRVSTYESDASVPGAWTFSTTGDSLGAPQGGALPPGSSLSVTV